MYAYNTRLTVPILGWRLELNNLLQVSGGSNRLHYVDIASGPAHRPTWSSTAHSKSDVPPLLSLLMRLLS